MDVTKLAEQPVRRDPGLAWEENGSGLHLDEIAVELDTGELVAVSVETKWTDGNTGLGLHGWARLINPDGSSQEAPDGKVIETSITFNAPAALVEEHGERALGREVMLAVLGEPPTMVEVPVDLEKAEADAAAAPPGTVLEPAAAVRPLISFGDEARRNASIRAAIATMKVVTAGIDPTEALGL